MQEEMTKEIVSVLKTLQQKVKENQDETQEAKRSIQNIQHSTTHQYFSQSIAQQREDLASQLDQSKKQCFDLTNMTRKI